MVLSRVLHPEDRWECKRESYARLTKCTRLCVRVCISDPAEVENEPYGPERGLSPTPVKPWRWVPRSSEVAYDPEGNFWFLTTAKSFIGIYVQKQRENRHADLAESAFFF